MANDRSENLGKQPIPRLMWSMCGHTVLSVMLYSLYSLMDTFFVARGAGAYAAGGVALAAPILQVLGALATTVGVGAASIVSRALGQKNKDAAGRTAANAFLLFWGCGALITLLGLLFLDPLMRLLGADEVLMPYAKGYSRILLMGAVTATGFSSLIRAEGNVRYSLIQWMVPALVNLALDPLFIFGFGMGVEGAALATVLSQVVSTGTSMYFFFLYKGRAYPIRAAHFRPKPKLMGEILVIGSPSLVAQLLNSGLTVMTNQLLGQYGGAVAISAYGIAARVKAFLTMPVTGIVQGIQPIIGYNHAARHTRRVRQTVRLALAVAAVWGLVVLVPCLAAPGAILGAFVSEPPVIALGAVALRVLALSFPFMGALTIASAYYQSTGRAVAAFALPIGGTLAVALPALLGFAQLWGLPGIWAASPAADALLCLISLLALIITFRRQAKAANLTEKEHHS